VTVTKIVLIALISVATLVVAAMVFVAMRSRVKVEANSALVRTGFGGMKIVTRRSESVFCLPLLHQYRMVPFRSMTVNLEIDGGDFASTKDGLSVTCKAAISASSLRDEASILEQLMNIESGASGNRQEMMLQQKSTAAVKRILRARDYADLAGSLSIVDPEGLASLSSQLETQGLAAERIEIENITLIKLADIDETDLVHLKTVQFLNEVVQKELVAAQQEKLDATETKIEELTRKNIAEGAEEANEKQAVLERTSQERKSRLDQDHAKLVSAIGESGDTEIEQLEGLGESSKTDLQAKRDADRTTLDDDKDNRLAQTAHDRSSALERIESERQAKVAEEKKSAITEDAVLSQQVEQAKIESEQVQRAKRETLKTQEAEAISQRDIEIADQRDHEETVKEVLEASRAETAHLDEADKSDGLEQHEEMDQGPE
jgi:hypothetical protein